MHLASDLRLTILFHIFSSDFSIFRINNVRFINASSDACSSDARLLKSSNASNRIEFYFIESYRTYSNVFDKIWWDSMSSWIWQSLAKSDSRAIQSFFSDILISSHCCRRTYRIGAGQCCYQVSFVRQRRSFLLRVKYRLIDVTDRSRFLSRSKYAGCHLIGLGARIDHLTLNSSVNITQRICTDNSTISSYRV